MTVTSGVLSDAARVEELVKGCNTLGPLEGIYVVVAEKPDKDAEGLLTELVANLDSVTRKCCTTIRFVHFFTGM